MKSRLVHLFAAALAAIALTFAGAAFAGGATDVVKAKQTSLFELLKQSTPESQKKIAAIFEEMLDYPSITEGSLGSEWAARSDAEKKEFGELLKKLVQKSYERNLKKLLDFEVQYVGEDGAGPVLVKTKAKAKAGGTADPVEVNFKMVQKDSKWKVGDIETEGVSLVSSYRSQFTKIIKKDGFPALIQKMKDKLAKGDV